MMENWRKFVKERRHYRLIVNEITQLTEEQLREFPLSDEELEKIKEWGDLKGEPSFLGSGTMGSAYLFDDNKVLKITSDFKEAQAAKLIEGDQHPNVYEVLKVARRWDRMKKPPKEEPQRPFVIVYEMVGEPGLFNFPNKKQKEIIQKAEATVERRKTWTGWSDDFESAKENFLKAAENYIPTAEEVPRFKSEESKLDSILDKMEGDKKDKESIKLAYLMSVGLIGGKLNTFESVEEIVNGEKFGYVSDLASGLTFLKKKGIAFTDLKTSNVMNVDNKLIIIDIGKSGVSGYVDMGTVGDDE